MCVGPGDRHSDVPSHCHRTGQGILQAFQAGLLRPPGSKEDPGTSSSSSSSLSSTLPIILIECTLDKADYENQPCHALRMDDDLRFGFFINILKS